MFLEIANNNGTKYIRICETVRVPDQKTGKSKPVKKTIKCFLQDRNAESCRAVM